MKNVTIKVTEKEAEMIFSALVEMTLLLHREHATQDEIKKVGDLRAKVCLAIDLPEKGE